MGRRRFIDRNKAVHFALVHNHDADDDNPSRNLMPFVTTTQAKKGIQVSDAAYEFADRINNDGTRSKPQVDEDLDGECYFPKDGYDYSQHLKAVEQLGVEVNLTQEEEDALNYDEPRTKVEEEIVEALADADMYDEGDEDFFEELLGGGVAEDTELLMWGEDHNPEGQKRDPFAAIPDMDFNLDEYLGNDDSDDDLCTLPVRANKDLDDELMNILEQYDDDQIGELDEEETMGKFEVDTFVDSLDHYCENRRTFGQSLKLARLEESEEAGKDAPGLHDHLDYEALSEEEYEVRTMTTQETWDVESLASMRSNLSNHPGKINRVKPSRPKREKKVELDPIGEDNVVLPEVDTYRPPDETKEEKKARKAAVKEQRRICREMKKQNKQVWKEETDKLKARSAQHGADVRLGVRTIPI